MLNFLSPKLKNDIKEKIYHDTYQYNKKEVEIIDMDMLSSIILNKNKRLFNIIIKNKKLSQEEKYYLLNIIANEGDEYIYFFNILYDNKILNDDFKIKMINSLIKSNAIKILNRFNLDLFNINKMNDSFKFNPNKDGFLVSTFFNGFSIYL